MRVYFLAILMVTSSYLIGQTEEEKIEYIRSVFQEANEFLNQGRKPTYKIEDDDEAVHHSYKFYSNENRLYKVEYIEEPVEGGPTEVEYYYDQNNEPVFIFTKRYGSIYHGAPYTYREERLYIDEKVIKKLKKEIKTDDLGEHQEFVENIANMPNEEASFHTPGVLDDTKKVKEKWQSKRQSEAQAAADGQTAYVRSVFKEVNKATNDGQNFTFKLEGGGRYYNFYSKEDRLYKIAFTEDAGEEGFREVEYYYDENNELVFIFIKDESGITQGAPYIYYEKRVYIDEKVFKKLQKRIKTDNREEYDSFKENIADIPNENGSFDASDELANAQHFKKVWQARR